MEISSAMAWHGTTSWLEKKSRLEDTDAAGHVTLSKCTAGRPGQRLMIRRSGESNGLLLTTRSA